MPTDLIIRPVARHDYERWLPLWDGYNAFYGRSGPTALDPEVTRMTWQRFFDAYAGLRAWHRGQPDGVIETRTLAGRRRLGVERFTEKLTFPSVIGCAFDASGSGA